MKKVSLISLCAVCAWIVLGCQGGENTRNVDVIYPTADVRSYMHAKQEQTKAQPKTEEKVIPVTPAPVADNKVDVAQPKTVAPQPAATVVPAAAQRKEEPKPVAVIKETPKQPAVKKEETKHAPAVAKSEASKDKAKEEKKKFSLRIISLPYHDYYSKTAHKIAEYMKKEHGIDSANARIAQSQHTKYWVVDVGKFDSSDTQEAKDFQKKVQETKYEGSYQFKDAFYVSY